MEGGNVLYHVKRMSTPPGGGHPFYRGGGRCVECVTPGACQACCGLRSSSFEAVERVAASLVSTGGHFISIVSDISRAP